MGNDVLVVGCGVFGLATAVEMALRGYKVTAVDAHPIPSPWSAANDFNKIIRTEYADLFYTKLALEALHYWRSDSDLNKVYCECGRLSLTPKRHKERSEFDKKGFENLALLGKGNAIKRYVSMDEFSKDFTVFGKHSLETDTEITFNPEGGLGYATESLLLMKKKAENLGVLFKCRSDYEVVRVVEDVDQDYVLTKCGLKLSATKILISSGAATAGIVNLKNQTFATGIFVGHIKLDEEEYKKYKNIPIVFSAEDGYYFPPDPKTKTIKIAISLRECSNRVLDQFGNLCSLPLYKEYFEPNDTSGPLADEVIRFLKRTLPDLAHHSLFDIKLCWISDTPDSHFLIDKIPGSKNTFVSTGDSGHGYKFLPTIGRYISDRLEDKLNPECARLWAWKERNGKFEKGSLNWRVRKAHIDLSKNNRPTDN